MVGARYFALDSISRFVDAALLLWRCLLLEAPLIRQHVHPFLFLPPLFLTFFHIPFSVFSPEFFFPNGFLSTRWSADIFAQRNAVICVPLISYLKHAFVASTFFDYPCLHPHALRVLFVVVAALAVKRPQITTGHISAHALLPLLLQFLETVAKEGWKPIELQYF